MEDTISALLYTVQPRDKLVLQTKVTAGSFTVGVVKVTNDIHLVTKP
jgi:hypothetical protein